MRFIAYRETERALAVADHTGRPGGMMRGDGRLERAIAGGRDGLKDLAAALLRASRSIRMR